MATRKAPVGRSLVYHPAEGETDPTGAPMAQREYAAVVTVPREDDFVQVVVTIDGGNNDFGLGIRVPRLVPLIGPDENALVLGAYCTWF
jgi:hypothetical protein